ncbi:MAG: hypothetical protein NXH73_06735 [Flavobacteriaceae bacterium]|nr:hypothetical protein [Flavobacteriaceae bacterium]
METQTKKTELLQWLENVTDLSVLEQIDAIKNRNTKPFDFEKEWENGYTVEEAKAESIRRIKSWWGKKK